MVSSSNREGGVCDAVLVREDGVAGPVRLPMNRVDDFVDHFNRVYGELGMQLVPLENASADVRQAEPSQSDPKATSDEIK
ncbi:MAG: hypothetical protein AAGG48_20740 [Planctomycetota bacterium]